MSESAAVVSDLEYFQPQIDASHRSNIPIPCNRPRSDGSGSVQVIANDRLGRKGASADPGVTYLSIHYSTVRLYS